METDRSKQRVKVFSISIKDCRVDTFTVGGHGGSGKDTSNTGVRITHPASGAVGKATDSRSQSANKRLAWRRLGESKAFRAWATAEASRHSQRGNVVEEQVEEAMKPENLKIEGINFKGIWVPFDDA
jgi:protein subunit release factor A